MSDKTKSREIEREWVSVDEGEYVTNLGKTKLYELIRDEVIKSRKVGKRRLLRLRSLRNLGQVA